MAASGGEGTALVGLGAPGNCFYKSPKCTSKWKFPEELLDGPQLPGPGEGVTWHLRAPSAQMQPGAPVGRPPTGQREGADQRGSPGPLTGPHLTLPRSQPASVGLGPAWDASPASPSLALPP